MTANITDDIVAGLAARHEGQAAVVAADVSTTKGHGTYVRQALDYWTRIRAGETFTSDDVRLMADYYARREGRTFDGAPNLLPAFMGAAARNRRIVEVGRTPSTRPSRRASKVTVYRAAHQSPAAYEAAGPSPAPAPHTGGRAAASRDGNPG